MKKGVEHISIIFRLGLVIWFGILINVIAVAQTKSYRSGTRQYECANHLGNVLESVSDKKIFQSLGIVASVSSYSDYYPFGMQLVGRNASTGVYRYGFQGQEKDDESKGSGNSINYKFRMHDPRLGRFFAEDPLTKNFPYNSAYAFSENRLIEGVELEGAELDFLNDKIELGVNIAIKKTGFELTKISLGVGKIMKTSEKSPYSNEYGTSLNYTKKNGFGAKAYYKYSDTDNKTTTTGAFEMSAKGKSLSGSFVMANKRTQGDVNFNDAFSASFKTSWTPGEGDAMDFEKLSFDIKTTGGFTTNNSFANFDGNAPLPFTTEANNVYGNLTGAFTFNLTPEEQDDGTTKNTGMFTISGDGKLGYKSIFDSKGGLYNLKLSINSKEDKDGFFYEVKSKGTLSTDGGLSYKFSETQGDGATKSSNSGSGTAGGGGF